MSVRRSCWTESRTDSKPPHWSSRARGRPSRSAGAGDNAFALDAGQGVLYRINGATDTITHTTVLRPAGTGERLYTSDSAAYVVDTGSGRVAVSAPSPAGRPASPAAAATTGQIESAMVDAGGRLWTLSAGSGDLEWFDEGGRHVHAAVGRGPGAQLVTVAGRPAVVDPDAGRVTLIDPATGTSAGSACIGAALDDRTLAAGDSPGSQVYLASGATGTLWVSDLKTGRCQRQVTVAHAGDRLGPPVVTAAAVFVPDYSSGKVAVVDVKSRTVVADPSVLPSSSEATFQLLARDGIVFYNDPPTSQAGVIRDSNGTVTVEGVAKYNPANPGHGLTPDNLRPSHASLPPPNLRSSVQPTASGHRRRSRPHRDTRLVLRAVTPRPEGGAKVGLPGRPAGITDLAVRPRAPRFPSSPVPWPQQGSTRPTASHCPPRAGAPLIDGR